MKPVRSVIRYRLSAVCFATIFALPLCAAQSPAKTQQSDTPALTQEERAQAAMEKSLAQQQAALDAFTKNTDSNSLHLQQASLQQQTAVLDGQDKGNVNGPASASPPQTGAASAKQAETTEATFFALPWPQSGPLAVPNVQMMDDSCQVLSKSDVDQLIGSAGKKYGVDTDLLRSVMRQESGFKPCAVSVAGAMGLMQIMPGTAEMLKLDDPFDPAQNVDAGASFLKMMLDRYQGNVPLALSAYNAGPGAVDKAGGVPPIAETVQYISNILGSLSLAY